MNYFKVLSKSFGIFFLIAALFYGICIPHQVKASIGVPFGGFDVGDDYEVCDCSGAVYSWFAPLYFGPTPATGALSWFPGTIEFSYYLPHPGAALLGTYIPVVQGCWMVVGYYCVPVPSLGVIAPVTGVSI